MKVRYIKLVCGDEIIGESESSNVHGGTVYNLQRPFRVLAMQGQAADGRIHNSVNLAPLPATVLPISDDKTVFVADPSQELAELYERVTSKIATPPAKKLLV
jgi:hypothetical protein